MLHRWNDWQVSALLLAHHFLFFRHIHQNPLALFLLFLNGPTSYFLFSQLADRCRRQVTRSMWMCHSSCWLLYMAGPRICMRLWGTSTRSHSHKVAISLSLLSRLFCCYCVVLASSRIFWEDVHIYFGWMYRMMSTHSSFSARLSGSAPSTQWRYNMFFFSSIQLIFFSFKRREEEEEEG